MGNPRAGDFSFGDRTHEALAHNALAGFLAEWEPITGDRLIVLPERMYELLNIARNEHPGEFSRKCPVLIGRKEALAILMEEVKSRNPSFEGEGNFNRHLARLAWPMSSLFTEKGFWELQIRQYYASRWTSEEDDPLVANAVFLAAGYGIHPRR